jgi:hypothetical protein
MSSDAFCNVVFILMWRAGIFWPPVAKIIAKKEAEKSFFLKKI